MSERADATTIQRQLQDQLNTVAGQKIVAFLPPALPGAQGLPIQFVLKSTQPICDALPAGAEVPRRCHGQPGCSCSSTAT